MNSYNKDNEFDGCNGCDLKVKCIEEYEESKLCPCNECLLKVMCSLPCEEWSIFLDTTIHNIIMKRHQEMSFNLK